MVAASIAGIAVGIAATQSGVTNLERVFVWSALLAAMLRYATPLLFAALGGLFSERSGVINIGLEGMMLMGAFWGLWGAEVDRLLGDRPGDRAWSPAWRWRCIHALFSVTLRADQIVSGFAMNFLALGITGYFFVTVYGSQGTPENIPRAPDVAIPLLEDIPFVGDVIGTMSILIWLGLLTVAADLARGVPHADGPAAAVGGREPAGGADRRRVAGAGAVSWRWPCRACSPRSAAPTCRSDSSGSFGENMTAGRGYIALAVLICGRWLPSGALVFACLFGFFSALAQRLPVFSEQAATLFQALPYVITLIAVAGVVGRSIPPAAIGRPLDR